MATAKKAAPQKAPKKAPKKVAKKAAEKPAKKATPKATAKVAKKVVKTVAKKAAAKAPAKEAKKPKAPAKKAAPKAKTEKKVTAATTAKASPSKLSAKTTEKHLQAQGFVPYTPKKGEEYMNEAQREHFKTILMNWRSDLMAEVDRTVHHMQDEAANPPDPADRATLEEEFSIELRTRDRERRLIKKIDSTIELIVNRDYGYCESCGVEIGIRRLEARPTATKCIDCKTLDEIKEKQLGA